MSKFFYDGNEVLNTGKNETKFSTVECKTEDGIVIHNGFKCQHCGVVFKKSYIDSNWKFCPSCGYWIEVLDGFSRGNYFKKG